MAACGVTEVYVNYLLTLTYTGERMTTHGKGLDFKRSEVLVADVSRNFKIIKNRPKNAGFCQKTSSLGSKTSKIDAKSGSFQT